MYSRSLLESIASEIKSVWPEFNLKRFMDLAFDSDWPETKFDLER